MNQFPQKRTWLRDSDLRETEALVKPVDHRDDGVSTKADLHSNGVVRVSLSFLALL